MRIAAVQAKPQAANLDELLAGADVEHALDLLAEAADQGADLVCFPELYPARGERELRERAKQLGVYVICGMLLLDAQGNQNTATLIGPDGSVLGRQAKLLPTQLEQDRGTIPGRRLSVVRTPLGKVGMMVCADLPWVSGGVAELKAQGADIIFNPSWWFAIAEAYPATVLGRHLEYGLPIIGVNMARHALVDRELGTLFPSAGGYTTAAIPPACSTLSELAEWFRSKEAGTNSILDFVHTLGEDEGILTVSVDLDAIRHFPGYFYSERTADPT